MNECKSGLSFHGQAKEAGSGWDEELGGEGKRNGHLNLRLR